MNQLITQMVVVTKAKQPEKVPEAELRKETNNWQEVLKALFSNRKC